MPPKRFDNISLETDAIRQLRELSAKLTGQTGKRVSMSKALMLVIREHNESAQFFESFGMEPKR